MIQKFLIKLLFLFGVRFMQYDTAFWDTLQVLVSKSKIIIEHLKGSSNPRFSGSTPYPLDYGYLENTSSMDGEGIDCFVGELNNSSISGILITIDLIKKDSEIKLLINCSNSDMLSAYNYINKTKFGKALLLKRY